MSTYVFSDVHGHVGPLRRALNRVSPSDDDVFYCLGDMIDRGPEPLAVVKTCYELPNCTVLQGNHEALMLDYFDNPNDQLAMINWGQNGAATTIGDLQNLPAEKLMLFLDWVRALPLWASVKVGERRYIMSHAGIRARREPVAGLDDEGAIADFMAAQSVEDLLWIRDDFWGEPTGLVDGEGKGPIVIAGHTPTLYLRDYDLLDRSPLDRIGRCRMVRVGATPATGGVADKWNIDCGAAAGAGGGQVLVLRLDDGCEFMEPVREGE